MDKILRWLRGIFRPPLTVLDIYGLERVTQRYFIAHGGELVDNFFQESPLMAYLKMRIDESIQGPGDDIEITNIVEPFNYV